MDTLMGGDDDDMLDGGGLKPIPFTVVMVMTN